MMVMEVEESNAVVVEAGTEASLSLDNERVNIKFGSHVVDETANGEEVSKGADSNLPTDAVDEWPQPMQTHSFYIVRYRAFEDQNLKAKMDLADKELQKKNQARLQIVEKIKAKRADRAQVIAQIRNLSVENKQYRSIMDEKRKEMEPLQQALGKLRGSSGGRDRGYGICSSEEELNAVIKSLQYRIQHESIPLTEEKQILREIKQLEGTREKVIANAAERAVIEVSLGEKDAIQDQVKLIGVDLDGVRKDRQLVNAKLKHLDEEKAGIEKEIGALEEELTAITEKRDKTFETVKELRKQREDGNTPFYQNRALLTKARLLAANKDLDALNELSNVEVENFMSLWSSNKSFREDYVRRILPSLDMRQLSIDGRLRNPDEKPLVQAATSAPETEAVRTSAKQPTKDDITPQVQVEVGSSSEQKAQKTKGAKTPREEGNKKSENTTEKLEEEEVFSVDKLPNGTVAKKEEVDEGKLKELKKEEEIAKRLLAEERKKKQAAKGALKAALKAQKEAEKRIKDREKRARKKAAGVGEASAEIEEATEAAVEDAEPEEKEEKLETLVPQRNKVRKENPIRQRTRRRGLDTLPKSALKRKKGTNYWMWAAPAALAAILGLVFVGYNTYFR